MRTPTLALTLLLTAVSGFAAPVIGGDCAPGGSTGTLQEFIALGNTGCMAQSGILFLGFAAGGGANTIPASEVTVQFVTDTAAQTTIQLTAPGWIAADGLDVSVNLGWIFVLPADNWWQSGVTIATGANTAPNSGNLQIFTFTSDDIISENSPFANLNGSTSLTVRPLVGDVGDLSAIAGLLAGSGGTVALESITASYEIVAAPEPWSFGVVGAGMLALALYRRRAAR